tara:strand:- start:1711 stop:2454 length:744 start_codon:yes stop_codon:yes gene_type:complete
MIRLATTQDSEMSLHHLSFRKERGAENMATDMWLLENIESWGGLAFRRYGWTEPQTTFGYGQKASWVEQATNKKSKELIRRPTGGGVVQHRTDLTYCMVLSKGTDAEKMPPMELYGLIHQRWGESLGKENISTCLMPCPDKSKGGIPGDCFKEPVGRDLMNGEGTLKLGGAAMKRTRKGVLIQGSLELGEWPGLDHGVIEKEFLLLIASDFNESISTKEWPDGLEADRLSLVNTYSSNSWTQGRRAP